MRLSIVVKRDESSNEKKADELNKNINLVKELTEQQSPKTLSWYYVDHYLSAVQGPFESVQMKQWFESGYFGRDSLVGRKGDTNFREVSAYFPDTIQAFKYDHTGGHTEMANAKLTVSSKNMSQSQLKLGETNGDFEPAQMEVPVEKAECVIDPE